MSTAKTIRLGRILQKTSQRAVIVPIDHGLTLGPLPGIESTHQISNWIIDPNINAVIAHKGMITRLAERGLLHERGVILHLNGMSTLATHPDNKEMLSGIETALHLGVDAVSLQVNFTGLNDRENLRLLGLISDQATVHGFPLFVMLYDKVIDKNIKSRIHRSRQLLRSAIELGADGIKIGMPETQVEVEEIFAGLHEDVLLFVAGGEVTDENLLLGRIEHALSSGASGVCVGRNVFARRNVEAFLERLSDIVHSGLAAPVSRGQLLHAY